MSQAGFLISQAPVTRPWTLSPSDTGRQSSLKEGGFLGPGEDWLFLGGRREWRALGGQGHNLLPVGSVPLWPVSGEPSSLCGEVGEMWGRLQVVGRVQGQHLPDATSPTAFWVWAGHQGLGSSWFGMMVTGAQEGSLQCPPLQ